jgi:RNA polymerase sigma factor (sigma-70 family)
MRPCNQNLLGVHSRPVTVLGAPDADGPVGDEAASIEDGAGWASLVRRITDGDREAEAELARAFHWRVRLMASVRLHGSDAALDITQDTFIAVLEALRAGRLRELERLPAFVLSIAQNLINNHLLAEARSGEVLTDPRARPAAVGSGPVDLDEQRRTLVRAALKRLDPLDRRILLLTLIEGLTPREIAPIVGLKPDTVRTRKARATRAVADDVNKLARKRRRYHIGTSRLEP